MIPSLAYRPLIYQVLPFCADWLTGMSTSSKPVVIVVLPLLSLMHDQVAKLASRSIQAICSVMMSHTVTIQLLTGHEY